jgi:CRP-like cAMP-binding protein
MNALLSDYIQRYISITEEELEIFDRFLQPIRVKKKGFLQQEGKTATSRYYIIKGCFRIYYIDDKGREQIVHFAIDHWWMADYDSLITQAPAKLYIQALEDSTVLALPQHSFDNLCQELPKTERLFRIIIEKTHIALQRRMEFKFRYSGEKYFKEFISANPEFAQRVPQYMIASYLGLTPEFVSKVKAKKSHIS